MTTTASLIEALSQPKAYPFRPRRIDILHTHISVLFFADDLVYKVKKPINPGFLDYSTLEKRKHFCEEEVRLNRRLAPDTYRGVATIVRDADDRLRVIAAGETAPDDADIVEYAVEMHRLPERFMLTNLLDRGEIDNPRLDALTGLLVRFHEQCATGEGVDEHATPEAVRQQIDENFADLQRHTSSSDALEPNAAITPFLHRHLHDWCLRFLDEQEALLSRRVEQGRIREGHGDLHAGNVCMMPGKIVIYDCIEFTPRFRCRDIACELAFFAMDLDKRGYRAFARYLVRRYAALAEDPELESLIDFYKLHLAAVRAKVAGMKATDEEVSDEDRAAAVREARSYAHLAVCYTLPPSVIVMTGLPAGGKSWTARAIARPFEAAVFRSDAIRKQLAGYAPTEHVPEAEQPRAYSAEFTRRTYETMFRRAANAIGQGRTVVLDAMFASAEQRQRAIAFAESQNAPWIVVHAYADDETIKQRLINRAADASEISDADWRVYEEARSRYEMPDEIDTAHCIAAIPAKERSGVVTEVLAALVNQAKNYMRHEA